jgi:hypothetical protein
MPISLLVPVMVASGPASFRSCFRAAQ